MRLPGRLATAVRSADWRTASLHALLVAAGVVPHGGGASITAQCATAADAPACSRSARNAALLVERRLIVDAGGHPVEYTESRYAASRYGLDVRFSVEPLGGG